MDGNFLSRYEKTITDLEDMKISDPDNSYKYDEKIITYIAKCIPYIKQYMMTGVEEETGVNVDKNTFGLITHKGKQKQQIYYKYLENVEGITIKQPPYIHTKKQNQNHTKTTP